MRRDIKDFSGLSWGGISRTFQDYHEVGRQTVVSGSRAKAMGFAFAHTTTCSCLELKMSFQFVVLDWNTLEHIMLLRSHGSLIFVGPIPLILWLGLLWVFLGISPSSQLKTISQCLHPLDRSPIAQIHSVIDPTGMCLRCHSSAEHKYLVWLNTKINSRTTSFGGICRLWRSQVCGIYKAFSFKSISQSRPPTPLKPKVFLSVRGAIKKNLFFFMFPRSRIQSIPLSFMF